MIDVMVDFPLSCYYLAQLETLAVVLIFDLKTSLVCQVSNLILQLYHRAKKKKQKPFHEPSHSDATTHAAAAAKSLQSCLPLCDPIDPTRLPCPWDSPGKNAGVGCHFFLQCVKVKSESEVAQSCLTVSDPMDCSPPGSPVLGILQARTLEWVAISFSRHMSRFFKKCNPLQMFYILHMVYGAQILGSFTLFFSFYYVFGGSGGQRAGISFQMSIIRKTQTQVKFRSIEGRQSVLIHWGCVLGLLNKIPQTGWFMNNRRLFSESQGLAL